MRSSQVVALFVGLTAAFSWEGALEDTANKAVHGLENVERLLRRQNTADESSAASTGTTARQTATTGNTAATGTTARQTGSVTATGSNSRATITGSRTGSGSPSASGNNTGAAASTDVDPRFAAGGVSMMIPDIFAGAQYYKIGDWVTFAWNYTSLLNAPTAVNVIASASAINNEWTIAANMSFAPSQTVFWDTNQYKTQQGAQLALATYTLIIENANSSKATSAPEPGGLTSVGNYMFGMYPPQPYVPFSDFTCPMCNGALGGSDRQAIGFMLGMASITILSFTWFSTGAFGIF